MSHTQPPRARVATRPASPRHDLALDDRERAYFGQRMGDWLLLAFVVVGLLANGLYVWHQLGPANDHTGRAIFFGLALLAAFWATFVFTFKLSVCVRVGPHSISVVRGPWRTELAWAQVTRLVERVQVVSNRRLRWVVAIARDGRSLQVREDMVADYARFRVEVWERYRLWRDHGGTWGATGATGAGGPLTVRETASAQSTWWTILAIAALLPGLYVWLILGALEPLGPVLIIAAGVFGVCAARALIRRRTYRVDARAIQSRQLLRSTRLAWRDVTRVDRSRHTFSGVMELGIGVGRILLRIASGGDGRVESFDWSPRVPEYLTLRGSGRQIQIRLHRLARPDEMLAWVEFYERAGRHAAESREPRRTIPLHPQLTAGGPRQTAAPDLSGASGPKDPWGEGREGFTDAPDTPTERAPAVTASGTRPPAASPAPTGRDPSAESSASWLRAEASGAWHPGMRPPAPSLPAAHPQEPAAADPPAGSAEPLTNASSGTGSEPIPPTGRDVPASAGSPPAMPSSEAGWTPPAWPRSTPPAPSVPSVPPAPSTGPLSHGRFVYEPRQDDVRDEVPPSAAEDAPTDSVEPLADAFRFWGTQSGSQVPRFPRFGPPQAPEPSPQDDPDQFSRDDFLR